MCVQRVRECACMCECVCVCVCDYHTHPSLVTSPPVSVLSHPLRLHHARFSIALLYAAYLQACIHICTFIAQMPTYPLPNAISWSYGGQHNVQPGAGSPSVVAAVACYAQQSRACGCRCCCCFKSPMPFDRPVVVPFPSPLALVSARGWKLGSCLAPVMKQSLLVRGHSFIPRLAGDQGNSYGLHQDVQGYGKTWP